VRFDDKNVIFCFEKRTSLVLNSEVAGLAPAVNKSDCHFSADDAIEHSTDGERKQGGSRDMNEDRVTK
jgi:hypothetical protein